MNPDYEPPAWSSIEALYGSQQAYPGEDKHKHHGHAAHECKYKYKYKLKDVPPESELQEKPYMNYGSMPYAVSWSSGSVTWNSAAAFDHGSLQQELDAAGARYAAEVAEVTDLGFPSSVVPAVTVTAPHGIILAQPLVIPPGVTLEGLTAFQMACLTGHKAA